MVWGFQIPTDGPASRRSSVFMSLLCVGCLVCELPYYLLLIHRVAIVTVSIIMSAVLTGCSHGNRADNRGSTQIKLFRCEMLAWEAPQRMEGRHTHAFMEISTQAHGFPNAGLLKWSESFFILQPVQNQPGILEVRKVTHQRRGDGGRQARRRRNLMWDTCQINAMEKGMNKGTWKRGY